METETKTNSKKDIGAIWVKTSAKGDRYLSAVVTIEGKKYNVVGFKNNFKEEGSSQPDYRLYESEQKPQTTI